MKTLTILTRRTGLAALAASVILSGCTTTTQQNASGSAASVAAPAAPVVASPTPTPITTPTPTAPVAIAAPTGLQAYVPHAAVTGRVRSIGSDTMDKLMQYWEEGFKVYHPGVRFIHEGKGSSTAPPALMEGRSDFGPMSRAMKDSEIAAFKAAFGYEPTVVKVAVDTLAVYVNPSNPIAEKGLDFTQLDAVFSATRKRGGDDVVTWGQLGLTGEWANAPIRVYSRNSASGTYGFFKEHVLKKGDYRATNNELVGSEALVEAVAKDRFAIGYSGIGYKTAAVATVPLSDAPGGRKFPAEGHFAETGEYPLARYLYMTLNMKPGAPTPLQREFVRYMFSTEGQEIVTRDGFFKVSTELAREELRKVGE